jgi:hypothetical protein
MWLKEYGSWVKIYKHKLYGAKQLGYFWEPYVRDDYLVKNITSQKGLNFTLWSNAKVQMTINIIPRRKNSDPPIICLYIGMNPPFASGHISSVELHLLSDQNIFEEAIKYWKSKTPFCYHNMFSFDGEELI